MITVFSIPEGSVMPPRLRLHLTRNSYVNTPDKTTILSAVKFSGTTSGGLSVGLIQSVTANEYAEISDGKEI